MNGNNAAESMSKVMQKKNEYYFIHRMGARNANPYYASAPTNRIGLQLDATRLHNNNN